MRHDLLTIKLYFILMVRLIINVDQSQCNGELIT